MEQEMGESEVTEEYQKAGGKNPSAHTATHHYKVNTPSTSATTGNGTTKQKDTKEKYPTQILTSHSAQHAEQNTGNPSTDKLIKILR